MSCICVHRWHRKLEQVTRSKKDIWRSVRFELPYQLDEIIMYSSSGCEIKRMTSRVGPNAAIAFFFSTSNAAGSQYADAMVNLFSFNIKDDIVQIYQIRCPRG